MLLTYALSPCFALHACASAPLPPLGVLTPVPQEPRMLFPINLRRAAAEEGGGARERENRRRRSRRQCEQGAEASAAQS